MGEDIQIEITADSEEGADDGDNEEESNDDEDSHEQYVVHKYISVCFCLFSKKSGLF